jgi:hypothetical protein
MSTMTSNQTISEQTKSNIDEIELDVTTSSQYFKPRPGTTYVIQVDLDKYKIKPVTVENPKFTDAQGKPLKRYEIVIVHINNQKQQTWTVSKTVCLQIIEQLRKGFNVMKVVRTGVDRSTTYQIEGVQ